MLKLAILAGLMAMGVSRLPGAPISEPDAVTIIDSGSTNRAGFRITVDQAGVAERISAPRRSGPSGGPQEQGPARQTLSPATLSRFRADLKAAEPFASLPEVRCMKSASFGSTLKVTVGGEQTPDLSCGDGGNAAMRNLIRDVKEIIALFEAH